ncbi:MAG TPA: cupin domain-containing protein [Streptosporangiaceae bacterium]|jgi:mannose-6-phosphate isomerase-like protein (cupin superfamily)
MNGLIVPPGQGRKITTKAQEVTFKVTGAHGSFASCFEVVVPPGFDVGAHSHDRSAEFFYVLEGELDVFAFEPVKRVEGRWQDWESPAGDRVVRAGAGSCMFVPNGCPHAFMNPTGKSARMLFQSYPSPDHERYFEELCEIFSRGPSVDSHAVQQLRDRYGLSQITPLRYGSLSPE